MQFKEIQYAYEILCDPDKRELYDRYGMSGIKEDAGGGPGSKCFVEELSSGADRSKEVQCSYCTHGTVFQGGKEFVLSQPTTCKGEAIML